MDASGRKRENRKRRLHIRGKDGIFPLNLKFQTNNLNFEESSHVLQLRSSEKPSCRNPPAPVRLWNDHHIGRQHLDQGRGREHLDHTERNRQGNPPAGRHHAGESRRGNHRTSPSERGTSVSQRGLPAPSGCGSGPSCAFAGACGLQPGRKMPEREPDPRNGGDLRKNRLLPLRHPGQQNTRRNHLRRICQGGGLRDDGKSRSGGLRSDRRRGVRPL